MATLKTPLDPTRLRTTSISSGTAQSHCDAATRMQQNGHNASASANASTNTNVNRDYSPGPQSTYPSPRTSGTHHAHAHRLVHIRPSGRKKLKGGAETPSHAFLDPRLKGKPPRRSGLRGGGEDALSLFWSGLPGDARRTGGWHSSEARAGSARFLCWRWLGFCPPPVTCIWGRGLKVFFSFV